LKQIRVLFIMWEIDTLITKDKQVGNHAGNSSQKYQANDLPLWNGLEAGVSQACGLVLEIMGDDGWWFNRHLKIVHLLEVKTDLGKFLIMKED